MQLQKTTYLLSILILLFSCKSQKDIYKECEEPKENITIEEYSIAFDNWLECLIAERIKEKKKKELYKDIRGKHIEGKVVGFEAKLSDSYLSYKALSKILTDKELKENLKSNDPSIKYHSFLTIAERKNDNVFEALKMVINDTTQVSTLDGCIVDEYIVADLCIDLVIEEDMLSFDISQPIKYQLTIEEKNELDKLILNSNLKLKYRSYLEKK